ncbi:hypothetical protein N5P37_008742 [Trichoderma harzianum]|uniref:Prion-inhibition and propagation HeLo domain-containing protein n=1 Tax=Trichoderma harzianum CBS 226.95 TaxID=983964 RepID=A0A2T4A760_TRIHA|nr:hypothetical protein M431DRAFT_484012 [Trichoderma harzianum CBS 226.95]KAK0758344.1 hypothetical protein N5P37_008742 [Trichoderma harzianum]PTB52915.1 hypothetical protein M431DRAFT_484012 [Trichoderma harzianum CBS 226.95]
MEKAKTLLWALALWLFAKVEFASVQVQYWRELAALGKLLGNAGEIGQKATRSEGRKVEPWVHAAVEGGSHLDRACDHSPSKGGQSSFIPNRKHHHLLICIEPNRSSARFRCNATPAASNEKCREDSDDQGGQSLDLTLPKIETELRTDTNALLSVYTAQAQQALLLRELLQTVWALQQAVDSGDLAWHSANVRP